MQDKEIKSMDEYYKRYLPKYAEKYPIEMRVSEEEQRYLRWGRGEGGIEPCRTKK